MYCILLFITKLLIYKCNMSFSRNINSISFDDTRKTPSLYSNQNDKCSYHHSNKRVLKENIAKIDSELLELNEILVKIDGMDDEELKSQSEICPLKNGRFLVVEG